MKRLVCVGLLCGLTTACVKPDLVTLLQDARFGLQAVCAIGQDTLPASVCSDGDTALLAAKNIASTKGFDAARPQVKQILTDLEAKDPAIVPWTHWLTAAL